MRTSNKVLDLATKTLHRAYEIFPKSLQLLGNNESLVYKITTNDFGVFVMRITSAQHRSLREISDELAVLRLLHQGGVAVAQGIRTLQGRDVEILQHQKQTYYLTVFTYIDGKKVQPYELDWNAKFFHKIGYCTGTMHAILAKHHAVLAKNNRQHRDQEASIVQAKTFLANDPDKKIILKKLSTVITDINKLPKNAENFGIIHCDIRPMNYHYHNDTINYFDFNDMCHHWFMYDIAVAAFHATEVYTTQKARTRFLEKFLHNILNGYSAKKTVSHSEISALLDFMLLRCIYVFIGYYKRIAIKHENTGKEKREKRRNYICDFNSFVDQKIIQASLAERSNTYLRKKPIVPQVA